MMRIERAMLMVARGGARALAWTSEKREVNSSTWIVATITLGTAAILVYLLLVGRAMFSLLTLGLL
jgi:hypothetical protein